MASLELLQAFTLLLLLRSTATTPSCSGPYTSIFSFGDSLTDTGNTAYTAGDMASKFYPMDPPYGMTYFHNPTGRCSDGRLIIDFLAEAMGLPLVPPVLGGGDHDHRRYNFLHGANFAMAGATALANDYFEEIGIGTSWINNSLPIQIADFKQSLSSDSFLISRRSLAILGEIGGNDYYFAVTSGKKLEDLQTLAPLIVKTISLAVQDLIEVGMTTIMVPGNVPLGCVPAILTYFSDQSAEAEEFELDRSTGCVKWLNTFSVHHNHLLQDELHRLRRRYPGAAIFYADYYNAIMPLYRSPHDFGFRSSLTACCGAGGRYNYNSSAECGSPTATVCGEPSTHVSWDGVHMTEAAYRIVTGGILDGTYVSPGRLTVGGTCNFVERKRRQKHRIFTI